MIERTTLIVVVVVAIFCTTCWQDIDVANQGAIDQLMLSLDGTENKCKSLAFRCVLFCSVNRLHGRFVHYII